MSEHQSFVLRFVIAFIVGLCIVVPVSYLKTKQYIKEGKFIKYLQFKVFLTIGLPILSIPFLLSENLSLMHKVSIVLIMGLGGIANEIGLTQARKTFRKILGLPPEDEHTGQVIKKEKNKVKWKAAAKGSALDMDIRSKAKGVSPWHWTLGAGRIGAFWRSSRGEKLARPLRLEDEGAFYHIETTDYHAGRVALSRADIIELLEVIDGKAGEKEQYLMADLEQDEDDF